MKLCAQADKNPWKRSSTYTSRAVYTCQRTALALWPKKLLSFKVCLTCLKKALRDLEWENERGFGEKLE